MGKVEGRAEFELVSAVLRGRPHESSRIAEIPCVQCEVLVAAGIADETRERVVHLEIETAYTAEGIIDLLLVFTLQAVINRPAHGVVHVQTSQCWVDASKR